MTAILLEAKATGLSKLSFMIKSRIAWRLVNSKFTISSTVCNISPESFYNDGSSVKRVNCYDGIDAMRTETLNHAFTISSSSQNASSIKTEITLAEQEIINNVK